MGNCQQENISEELFMTVLKGAMERSISVKQIIADLTDLSKKWIKFISALMTPYSE